MDAGLSPARQARAHHRHELRTLTYVTLDQANGGIVRNLSHEGIGVQVVAAVRPRQQLRVRFELRYPRLRVESRGEVMWATFSGQCGIRFLDLSPRAARQIKEWIFGDLLDGAALHDGIIPLLEDPVPGEHPGHTVRSRQTRTDKNDGLLVSGSPLKVIELRQAHEHELDPSDDVFTSEELPASEPAQLDWLSQPLSGSALAWTVNSLVITAALLLFALVFLVVTRELPRWPFALTGGATGFVACFYWGFFKLFGGISPGTRLARLAADDVEEAQPSAARFR